MSRGQSIIYVENGRKIIEDLTFNTLGDLFNVLKIGERYGVTFYTFAKMKMDGTWERVMEN